MLDTLLALRGGPFALEHEYGLCKPSLSLDAALARESVATVSEDDDGCVRWGVPKHKDESGSQTIRPGSSPRERWTEKIETHGFLELWRDR